KFTRRTFISGVGDPSRLYGQSGRFRPQPFSPPQPRPPGGRQPQDLRCPLHPPPPPPPPPQHPLPPFRPPQRRNGLLILRCVANHREPNEHLLALPNRQSRIGVRAPFRHE